MRTPEALEPGDEVRLVTPSRWADEALVSEAEAQIRAQGLVPTRGQHLLEKDGQLGGTDVQRAEDFINAWNDERVKAIWALRGGYGAQRILSALEEGVNTSRTKWFIGFSDSTAIHGLLNNLEIKSLHAPMWSTIPRTMTGHVEATFRVLNGQADDIHFNSHPSDVKGLSTGRLVGGNLSVLQTMVGTSSFPVQKGDILFIEDIDEMLYHVDRMLLHLSRSGSLGMLGGIVLGEMSDMRDNTKQFGFSTDNPIGKGLGDILSEHLCTLGIPVGFDFPAGHGENNHPLILGAHVRLEVRGDGNRLSYNF